MAAFGPESTQALEAQQQAPCIFAVYLRVDLKMLIFGTATTAWLTTLQKPGC